MFSSSSPGLKARLLPRFPARVLGASGITVEKEGLAYTISLTFGPGMPPANDGASLGADTLRWSDLYLASGAVINWPSATLTHVSGGHFDWAAPLGLAIASTDSNAFTVGPTGAVNPLLRVNAVTGNVELLQGLKFPAAQVPQSNVNTLDDYEEGTWTPVLTCATPGNLAVVYSVQIGAFTKIGNLVLCSYSITTSTFTHSTAAGQLQITGLPFLAANVVNFVQAFAVGQWGGINKASYQHVAGILVPNTSVLLFSGSGMGQVASAINLPGDVPSGGTVVLRGNMGYLT